MAVDYKAALTAAIWTALGANSGVTTAFKVGNRWDERTIAGVRRPRLASSMPNDKPSLAVEIIGGEEQVTRTPHFGLVGTVTVCDAIVPIVVNLRVTMRYDKEKLADQTSPETYVRQALHQGYPKLGLSYVQNFTIRERRTPQGQQIPVATAGGFTEVQWDLTVNLRMHLSQLRD